jgi:PAS domain S-box-containing protein
VPNRQGKTVGVLSIRYHAAILQQVVASTTNLGGKESYAILLDENHLCLANGKSPGLIYKTILPLDSAKITELQSAGRLPSLPVTQLSTRLPKFEESLQTAPTQPFFRAELETTDNSIEAVAVASMTSQPWLVAFGQPEKIFLAPARQQTSNALFTGAALVFLVVLAVAGGTRLLIGPIERLRRVAERVGAGDLEVQARVESRDEIGALASTFNTMTAQLRLTLEGLARRSGELRRANERLEAELAERQRVEAALRDSEARYRSLVNEVNDGFFVVDRDGRITFANHALTGILGFTDPGQVTGRLFSEFVSSDQSNTLPLEYQEAMLGEQTRAILEFAVTRQDGSLAFVEMKPQVILEAGKPAGIRGVVRDITGRKQAEEEIQHRLEELEAVNQLSTAMRLAQNLPELLPVILDTTLDVMHANQGSIWLYNPEKDDLRVALARGVPSAGNGKTIPAEKPGQGIAGFVFATRSTLVEREFRNDPLLPETVRQRIPPRLGGAAVPIRAGDDVIGVLILMVPLPAELSTDQVHLLTILCEIAGNAIQRTLLHQQTEQRLRKLGALHAIDSAINAFVDLRSILNVFLDQVVTQLQVDAATVTLLNPLTRQLEYVSGRGFRTPAIQQSRYRPGEGNTSRAVLERRTVHIPDLRSSGRSLQRTGMLVDQEGFVTYFGVPLIAKGQVKGVLEVFQRTSLEPDREWLDFLEALAAQAAIAVDNATLFEDLQHSNTELMLAYDDTIEGWSRALDLRDRETEGHTRRVTEVTLQLAAALGVREAEMVNIRRGALLHDIGKMGIPDQILFKPGPLTEEEWAIMRRHPQYAHDMLSPISYLRSALDIPYCHHEKWDGSGYPRGLKGKQIPLAARLFAVVDVWDALNSDRPYRAAWPGGKVLAYIQTLSGAHFDPEVVEIFLNLELPVHQERVSQ